jgi:hypothetical protein
MNSTGGNIIVTVDGIAPKDLRYDAIECILMEVLRTLSGDDDDDDGLLLSL